MHAPPPPPPSLTKISILPLLSNFSKKKLQTIPYQPSYQLFHTNYVFNNFPYHSPCHPYSMPPPCQLFHANHLYLLFHTNYSMPTIPYQLFHGNDSTPAIPYQLFHGNYSILAIPYQLFHTKCVHLLSLLVTFTRSLLMYIIATTTVSIWHSLVT